MSGDPGSDRMHAFVDGQLEAGDKARLLEEMERDPELRRRVCELRQVKEYVTCAFAELPAAPARRTLWGPWAYQGAAALLLLCAGFLAGRWSDAAPPELHSQVVVHLDSADQARLRLALADAESLAARPGEEVQVEVVANGGGLRLISDDSPLADEVRALMARRANIHFVACGIAVQKQSAAGRRVALLPGVKVATSASDYILGRLEQGWSYLRV